MEGTPEVVHSKKLNFATEASLFGLCASCHAALEALHQLADQHRLCYGALGLEKLKAGRACFRATIKLCAGMYCGQETPETHAQRLMEALEVLRVACWPYPGAIGLTERHEDHCQIHVIRDWCYLGSASDWAGARALDSVAAGFDADGYKILCRYILSGQADITLLQAAPV